jgi:hypothetical protein
MTSDRWDTRTMTMIPVASDRGQPYALARRDQRGGGPVTHALGELFRERWHAAGGKR